MGQCWSGLTSRSSASLRKIFTLDGGAQSERLSAGGSLEAEEEDRDPSEIRGSGMVEDGGDLDNGQRRHQMRRSKLGLARGFSVLSSLRSLSRDDMKRLSSHHDFHDLENSGISTKVILADDGDLGFQSGDGYYHVASSEAEDYRSRPLASLTSSQAAKQKQTYQKKPRLPRLFDLAQRNRKNKYARQSDDTGFIELHDIVPPHSNSNPSAYYQPKHSPHHQRHSQSQGPKSRQVIYPDVRQVAGLRHTLTCSWRSGKNYKMLNAGPGTSGNALVTLDPRLLAAQENGTDWTGSIASLESGYRKTDRATPNSCDLEWENDDVINQTEEIDNLGSLSVNDTSVDTCSIAQRSHASSQVSIPGLDWDSQGESADLLSLNNVPLEEAPLDFETEQLICEIEQLTSQALKETNQWNEGEHEDIPLWKRVNHAKQDESWKRSRDFSNTHNQTGIPGPMAENLNCVSLENNNISQEWKPVANQTFQNTS